MGRETNKNRREAAAKNAREKAAAARAQAQQQERRRRAMVVLSSVVVIALAAVVVVVIAINHNGKNDPAGNQSALPAAVFNKVTSVSDATLETIGAGNVATLPKPVTGEAPLTANGKPEVLYIGAEFCPYCAVERWSLVTALSRFGTFKGVSQVHSGADDGNFASLDFLHASYQSKYLTFTTVENADRNRHPLQPVTTAQKTLWSKLTDGQDTYPFIDFGNKLALAGNAPLDPSVLGSLTQAQVADQLNDPSSKVAQTVGGGANDIIASVCSLTNNQPSTVCNTSTIKSLQTTIAGSSSS